MRDAVERLERSVGVQPDNHWLEACQSFFRENLQEGSNDAILHQILHADLRDVVRSPTTTTSRSDPLSCSAASQRLQQAIQNSKPSSAMAVQQNQHKSQPSLSFLDKSFRLLVQVEELLDVSQNAEARLAVGPASPNAPTPIGNQRLRCLKLCVSDGYLHEYPLIAMEIKPIPNLSVNTKAGVKVVIQGPLDIRYGIMIWHPGNATVLGGCVEELVQIQHQALALAKKVAGVGVDPTIRALIGTTPDNLDDQEDEGEGESRDVVAAPPTTTTTATTTSTTTPINVPAPPPQQRVMPPPRTRTPPPSTSTLVPPPVQPATNRATGTSSMATTNNRAVNQTTPPNPYSTASAARPLTTATAPRPSIGSMSHAAATSSNSYGSGSATTAPSTTTSSNPYSANKATTTPITSQTRSSTSNPYSSVQPHTAAAAATTTTSNPYNSSSRMQQQQQQQLQLQPPPQPAPNNPYSNRSITNVPQSSLSAATPIMTTNTTATTAPSSFTRPTTTVATSQTSDKSDTVQSQHSSADMQVDSTESSSSENQQITFGQLHTLLAQLVQDKDSYTKQYGKVFTVTLMKKGKGEQLYFNIEKKKNGKKKKKKSKKKGGDGDDKNDRVSSFLRHVWNEC
jgi:hypothetical protein